MKKTKIIATVGPSSKNPKVLETLFKAGVDACRLNFSFGSYEEHLEVVKTIRAVSRKVGKPIAIIQDLQGPKIRIGKLKAPVTVKKGDELILTGSSKHVRQNVLPTTYTNIANDAEVGKTILLADGTINLKVLKIKKENRAVHCRVNVGGTILTGKGINLPYIKVSLPSLTPKDRRDLQFGIKAGVDYIAESFVRTAADVAGVKRILKRQGADIPVIAKIEKPEAFDCIEEIVDAADGIMVARGDLAVEISLARVPVAQKEIIRLANRKGKITITATQMLESMIENPVPTRAEASDVANAILDGTDAVMLSGETATGKYPLNAIRVMSEIAEEIEASQIATKGVKEMLSLPEDDSIRNAICSATAYLSYLTKEKGLAVFSGKGLTVRILSKFRPETNIFAASNEEAICNRMALLHNVSPILLSGSLKDAPASISVLKQSLLNKKLVKKGDKIIILTGGHYETKW
ncbi:MAG: pyruvate kinase, partial [Deltaproteobacteria bacterium]|nr:pyruvate kinase [Deltaproteobacteria bacterium]